METSITGNKNIELIINPSFEIFLETGFPFNRIRLMLPNNNPVRLPENPNMTKVMIITDHL